MAYYCKEEPLYRYGTIIRSFLPERAALLLLIPGVGVRYVVFARFPHTIFSVGMTIRFVSRTKASGVLVISDISFEQTAADWAGSDLLFVHHLCELCQRFVFTDEDAGAVFTLMQELYQSLTYEEDVELKKLAMLSKFFILLGHYAPPLPALDGGADAGEATELARQKKRTIKQWLRACICACEPAYALKTIHFLTT